MILCAPPASVRNLVDLLIVGLLISGRASSGPQVEGAVQRVTSSPAGTKAWLTRPSKLEGQEHMISLQIQKVAGTGENPSL
jgi:hypothetical protein